eukprot:9867613-Alexandrium_andersonii.AAC.1
MGGSRGRARHPRRPQRPPRAGAPGEEQLQPLAQLQETPKRQWHLPCLACSGRATRDSAETCWVRANCARCRSCASAHGSSSWS